MQIDGLLLPGHVSVIIGADAYRFLVDEFGVPATVVGFAPVDILLGVLELMQQVQDGTPRVANLYARVVRPQGNRHAQQLIARFFEPVDTRWRGLGEIPGSGLGLRAAWAHRDASAIDVAVPEPREPRGCRCGEVLKGVIQPPECPLFDRGCTPETPLGACMVSSEGTCAAWYRHERRGDSGMKRGETLLLAHGSGGRLTHELVRDVFLPALDNPYLRTLSDSAVLGELPPGRPALTTDAFVVDPPVFPGGDLGYLSVCGTVNDLAVAGARPLWLTWALVLEEGLDGELLHTVVEGAARACQRSWCGAGGRRHEGRAAGQGRPCLRHHLRPRCRPGWSRSGRSPRASRRRRS